MTKNTYDLFMVSVLQSTSIKAMWFQIDSDSTEGIGRIEITFVVKKKLWTFASANFCNSYPISMKFVWVYSFSCRWSLYNIQLFKMRCTHWHAQTWNSWDFYISRSTSPSYHTSENLFGHSNRVKSGSIRISVFWLRTFQEIISQEICCDFLGLKNSEA